MQRAHPSIYGYVPPAMEGGLPSRDGAVLGAAAEEADEEVGCTSEDISPSKDANSSINTSSGSIHSIDFTPMDVDTPLAAPPVSAACDVGLSISRISGDILGSNGASSKKRRITPLLVASSTAAPAPAAESIAPIAIPSIGEAPSPMVVELHQRKQEEGRNRDKKRVTLQYLGPSPLGPPAGNAQ